MHATINRCTTPNRTEAAAPACVVSAQVEHSQRAVDEFDYSVTSLREDLRSGVRLAKLYELLSGTAGQYACNAPLHVHAAGRQVCWALS